MCWEINSIAGLTKLILSISCRIMILITLPILCSPHYTQLLYVAVSLYRVVTLANFVHTSVWHVAYFWTSIIKVWNRKSSCTYNFSSIQYLILVWSIIIIYDEFSFHVEITLIYQGPRVRVCHCFSRPLTYIKMLKWKFYITLFT